MPRSCLILLLLSTDRDQLKQPSYVECRDMLKHSPRELAARAKAVQWDAKAASGKIVLEWVFDT